MTTALLYSAPLDVEVEPCGHPHVLPLDLGLTSIHSAHRGFVPELQFTLSDAQLLNLSSVWQLSFENYLSEVMVVFREKAPMP